MFVFIVVCFALAVHFTYQLLDLISDHYISQKSTDIFKGLGCHMLV